MPDIIWYPNSNLNDPTTSPQAKALFGMNIAVSLTSFVMGLVMLLLKSSFMRSVKGKTAEENEAEIKMSNDVVYTDNPLQSMSDNKNDADSRVYELEMENADLKTENTILQEKIKMLESKSENNIGNESVNL